MTLAEEPGFNLAAGIMGVVHQRKQTVFPLDRFGIVSLLHREKVRQPRDLVVNVTENVLPSGAVEIVPDVLLRGKAFDIPAIACPDSADTRRWRIKYSRGVHKIAFEWYAFKYYVTGDAQFAEAHPGLTDPPFNAVRHYGRYGNPQDTVRPLIRYRSGINDRKQLHVMAVPPNVVLTEMNLMGTHWIAALTGTPDEARRALDQVAQSLRGPAMLFDDEVTGVGPHLGKPISTFWRR